MKVINRHQVDQHSKRIEIIETQFQNHRKELEKDAPKSITLKLHKGDGPRTLAKDVVIMPGDYFYEDENDNPIIIAAADIGEGKTWEPVK